MSSSPNILFNPSTLRNLADKSYEKRKTAAVEIEHLVRQLSTQPGSGQYINSIISTLVADYTFSAQPNSRKGGLIGLSSIAIALLHHSTPYLELILPPVLRCFVDQDPRVRYYACEALYNIAKICRADILLYINELFDGLCKLTADQDADVRAACMLLDRLLKDIVSSCDAFNIAHFIPLLRERIRLKHPHVRLLIVNWVSMLNSLYDASMTEFLPDLLGGLFAMLSDPHKDVKAQTMTILQTFLQQIIKTHNVEFATMIFPIVQHSTTNERTTRSVIITWLHNFITLAREQLLPFLPHIIGALFCCIHDESVETGEVKQNAIHCNELLLHIVKNAPLQQSNNDFPTLLSHFIAQLSTSLLHARIVALQWLSLLLTKYDNELFPFFDTLLPPLLLTLQCECDMQVFVLLIECIARLALLSPDQYNKVLVDDNSENKNNNATAVTITQPEPLLSNTTTLTTMTTSTPSETTHVLSVSTNSNQLPPHFKLVFVNLLSLFATDVKFLELRAQRILCSLSTFIPPRHIYGAICQLLKHNQDLLFTKLIVETLHMVLFTTEECAPLRQILIQSAWNPDHFPLLQDLMSAFMHSPIPAISLALLSQNYALASGILSYMTTSPNFQVSVGLLLQLEQFVQLFESSIFSHCRCHLLSIHSLPNVVLSDLADQDAELHRQHIQALLHALYSLLALLPQSHCFFTLKNRLETSTVIPPLSSPSSMQSLPHVSSKPLQLQQGPSTLSSIHQIISEAVHGPINDANKKPTSIHQRLQQQVALVTDYVAIQKQHDLFHINQQHASFLTPGR